MFEVKYKYFTFSSLFIVYIALLFYLLEDSNGVRIKDIHVPGTVNNNSQEPLNLDCYFEYDNRFDSNLKENELVVKWNLNNTLLYQWSYNRTPYVHNLIKNRIDVNQRTSQNIKPTNIPLIILKKSIDLNGLYECKVTTFTSEDSRQQYMLVYVPVNNISLDKSEDSKTDQLIITCGTEGVYPQPNISLIFDEKRLQNYSTELNITKKNELYDINATYTMSTNDLNPSTIFNCSIILPEANRTYSKTILHVKAGFDIGDGKNFTSETVPQFQNTSDCSTVNICNIGLFFISLLITRICNL